MGQARESVAEATFALFCRGAKLPPWKRNYRFWKGRKFELDFAWPDVKVALEIQGVVRGLLQGGHQTADGMRDDFIKHNKAVLDGWILILVTQGQVHSGYALEMILDALEQRKGQI